MRIIHTLTVIRLTCGCRHTFTNSATIKVFKAEPVTDAFLNKNEGKHFDLSSFISEGIRKI